jgi:hypothetical protein
MDLLIQANARSGDRHVYWRPADFLNRRSQVRVLPGPPAESAGNPDRSASVMTGQQASPSQRIAAFHHRQCAYHFVPWRPDLPVAEYSTTQGGNPSRELEKVPAGHERPLAPKRKASPFVLKCGRIGESARGKRGAPPRTRKAPTGSRGLVDRSCCNIHFAGAFRFGFDLDQVPRVASWRRTGVIGIRNQGRPVGSDLDQKLIHETCHLGLAGLTDLEI